MPSDREPAAFVDLDDPTRLRLRGELDLDSSGYVACAVEDWINSVDAMEVTVMCGDLEFIDSSGLHLLTRLQNRATARGVRMVLADPPRSLLRVLELSGLAGMFDIGGGSSGAGPVPDPAEPNADHRGA